MQQIYTDPSPPPLLPSFWSGARSFFLFPALHHLLHRLLQIPLPSLFSPQCFHLDTYPCSKRDHDFSPHQAFQQHLTSSQFVQEPPDSKEQSSFQTASISWISCTHTLQEIPYQTAQLLPGCAQVTVELKSWVHSAPLLLLPVVGRSPGWAHIPAVAWPGVKSHPLQPLSSYKVPRKKQQTHLRKSEALQILGQWMGSFWSRHFSNHTFQLKLYFRQDSNLPWEHIHFQKMALQKKYWTETFQWDQNIWMGKARFVRMDMDRKGDFARKPLSQLGLGWIQTCQR